jgi:hypothetical protein
MPAARGRKGRRQHEPGSGYPAHAPAAPSADCRMAWADGYVPHCAQSRSSASPLSPRVGAVTAVRIADSSPHREQAAGSCGGQRRSAPHGSITADFFHCVCEARRSVSAGRTRAGNLLRLILTILYISAATALVTGLCTLCSCDAR